jgi:hypothetical protein
MKVTHARRGPEFTPVCREDKVEEWAKAINAATRYCDDTEMTEAKAADYAEKFWQSLEHNCTPVRTIMGMSGAAAAQWALFAFAGTLSPAPGVTVVVGADTNGAVVGADLPAKSLADEMRQLARRADGNVIDIAADGKSKSSYLLRNAGTNIRQEDGVRRYEHVVAELTINHARLRALVAKARGGKSQEATDGPLTVRIRGGDKPHG